MRLLKSLVMIPALALLAMSCGPRHPCMSPHGAPCKAGMAAMAMAHGCGPESCTYQSRCFSSGAVRSNDGVCQSCSGGKWVEATGCSACGKCSDCGGMMGKMDKKSGPCRHPDCPMHKHQH
jgi:hypothetical protein